MPLAGKEIRVAGVAQRFGQRDFFECEVILIWGGQQFSGPASANEIRDARAGTPERPNAGGVWLNLVDALRPHLLEAFDPVGLGPRLERGQPRQLRLVQRHDELARERDGDPALGAVALHEALACTAEQCLLRARRVVQPRVDDAGVVPGLVGRNLRLALQHRNPQTGPLLEQAQRGGQANDACADDGDINALRRGGIGRQEVGRGSRGGG